MQNNCKCELSICPINNQYQQKPKQWEVIQLFQVDLINQQVRQTPDSIFECRKCLFQEKEQLGEKYSTALEELDDLKNKSANKKKNKEKKEKETRKNQNKYKQRQKQQYESMMELKKTLLKHKKEKKEKKSTYMDDFKLQLAHKSMMVTDHEKGLISKHELDKKIEIQKIIYKENEKNERDGIFKVWGQNLQSVHPQKKLDLLKYWKKPKNEEEKDINLEKNESFASKKKDDLKQSAVQKEETNLSYSNKKPDETMKLPLSINKKDEKIKLSQTKQNVKKSAIKKDEILDKTIVKKNNENQCNKSLDQNKKGSDTFNTLDYQDQNKQTIIKLLRGQITSQNQSLKEAQQQHQINNEKMVNLDYKHCNMFGGLRNDDSDKFKYNQKYEREHKSKFIGAYDLHRRDYYQQIQMILQKQDINI